MMLNLIMNEWIKLFSRSGTIIMVELFVFMIFGIAGISMYDEIKYPPKENNHWKAELKLQIEHDQDQLMELGNINDNKKMNFERKIAINEYKIARNIEPSAKLHVWDFVRLSGELIRLIGIYVIIIAAGIVSAEFSWGTIKLLAIRPIKRSKILLSKYLTVLLFGLVLSATLLILSTIIGIVLFGFPDGEVFHLAYYNGNVIERNIVGQLILEYILNSVDLLMIATMAFMISAIFRNSNLAIGLSVFSLFMGKAITVLFAEKFNWLKYFLFANTDLSVYIDGVPLVEGMTLSFSMYMLCIYLGVFLVLSILFFSKRDIY
ncbi:ABC transporter permease [Bacillus marasmi]|uniref:ABC transporter permease n=1 Tax=Bacillus marasmi TaxID=1926279 RepID=UPI001FE65B41|nr:ABC transporter permease [Bacillus marasmi]